MNKNIEDILDVPISNNTLFAKEHQSEKYIKESWFESEEELQDSNLSRDEIPVRYDYFESFAGMVDVIRREILGTDDITFSTHFGTTQHFLLKPLDDSYQWQSKLGTYEHVYEAFKIHGITLQYDIFALQKDSKQKKHN